MVHHTHYLPKIIDELYYIITGVEPFRRDKEVERLNQLYSEVISRRTDLSSCLLHFVKTESYRMLDGWTYSINPEPIRNGQGALELPDQTDVIY